MPFPLTAARAAALCLVVLLGACTPRFSPAPACRSWEYAADSTEPPVHCLFFPVGLAMDPLGDALYVTNSNADLSFGGATLVTIDLLRYERAVGCFRRYGGQPGRAGDADCGIVDCADSGLRRLPAGATFEAILRLEGEQGQPAAYDRCYCEVDPLDRKLVNCAADRFVLYRQTRKTGNFSGMVRLLAEDPPDWRRPDPELTRRLFLPVRGDPSVTLVDVVRPSRLERPPLSELQLDVRCGEVEEGPVRSCDDAHRVQRTADTVPIHPDRPEEGERPRLELPPEPFSVTPDRGCKLPGYRHRRGDRDAQGRPLCRDGSGSVRNDLYYEYLVSTHLSGPELAVLDLLPPGGWPVLADVRGGLIPTSSQGARGAFSAAARVPGDLSQPWYVTSRLSGQITTFRLLSGGPAIVPGLLFNVSSAFAGTGQDVRDLVFEPGGGRAFMTLPSPPSLLVLDTRPDPLTGVPFNQVLSVVDICAGPARMGVARVPRLGTDGKVRRHTLIYVPCYQSGQVAVVDPDAALLVATIQVGRGPQTVVFNFGGEPEGGAIDPCADPYVSDEEAALRGVICPPAGALRPTVPQGGESLPLPPRAYVATYLDNAIAVIDLDPRSLTYHRVVGRIGLPIPKQRQ
ncbi:MAG: YncE family protein [Myxococcales bacterium]|nr:YncE family protein [Myxococcota bacterium]MDW8283799.1 YncE family protein [Myxococcales bacterium]